jgi:DNA mismatch repair protein MutH
MPINQEMMEPALPYNRKDSKSIEAYAQKLLNKSLREVLGSQIKQTYSGKGKLGQILEDLYFQYKPNSESEPDFAEAGVELKTSPLKKITKGLTSKERLVFNIINYEEEHSKTFKTSSFWKKNKLLLLMFFLYQQGIEDLDYIFKIIHLWEFPPTDLKIIEDDWQKIISKIKTGKAHEISEGDTLYLGACTKGANRTSLRKQPFSNEMAMQRAFSLKSKYLNYIIGKSLPSERIVKDTKEYKKGESLEDIVRKRFTPYYGMSENEIIQKLKLPKSDAKSRFYIIAKAILGIKKEKIEEFEKADLALKTIRLEHSGALKESMSFAQIQYKEIINESWDDSYWFNTLTKRFFFVVFQKDEKGEPRLKKVIFWTMPVKDLEVAHEYWLDTKKKITKNDFSHFIKISDDRICHVRPKGTDSRDLMETATGTMEKKMCYWLNSSYIKEIIK